MSIKLFIINKEACELRCLGTRFFAKLPSKSEVAFRVTRERDARPAGRGENRDFFRDDAKNREKNADFSQKGILFPKKESLAGSPICAQKSRKNTQKAKKAKNRDFLRLLKPCFLKLFFKKAKNHQKNDEKNEKRLKKAKKGPKKGPFFWALSHLTLKNPKYSNGPLFTPFFEVLEPKPKTGSPKIVDF